MPNGRFSRRTLQRLAWVFTALIGGLTAGAGCQRLPLRYAEVSPESTSRPTTQVESASSTPRPPSEMPEVIATPVPDAGDKTDAAAEPTPDGSTKAAPMPTPLLDAALARVELVKTDPTTSPEEMPGELTLAQAKTEPPTQTQEPAQPEVAPVEVPATPPKIEEAPAAKPAETAAVAVEPKPIDPEKAPEPFTPRDDWSDSLARLRDLSRRRAGEPGDAAEAWAIRSRVLDWLAGEGDAASDKTWNQVLAALSSATSTETREEPIVGQHLGLAVESLESLAPLQITDIQLCRKIHGFGHYESLEGPSLRAGQPLLVYCEMSGLKNETGTDGFRSRLLSQAEIFPAAGGSPVWSQPLGTAEDLCRRRRRDYYVNYRIVLPATLTPGSYSLRMTQTDLIANRSVSDSVTFTVEP